MGKLLLETGGSWTPIWLGELCSITSDFFPVPSLFLLSFNHSLYLHFLPVTPRFCQPFFPIFVRTLKHHYCHVSAYTLRLMGSENSCMSHHLQQSVDLSRYQALCFPEGLQMCFLLTDQNWKLQFCMMYVLCERHIMKFWLCLTAWSLMFNSFVQNQLLEIWRVWSMHGMATILPFFCWLLCDLFVLCKVWGTD